jgi:hypothetical protein
MSARLDLVRVDVDGEMISISWDERDHLLEELAFAAGTKPIRERFEAIGASRPVQLDMELRARLRAVLDDWEEGSVQQPEGIARLHSALVRHG